jgi:hypothetical protein
VTQEKVKRSPKRLSATTFPAICTPGRLAREAGDKVKTKAIGIRMDETPFRKPEKQITLYSDWK